MPDLRRSRCRRCGKHRDEVGHISWGGNCRHCGIVAALENIDGLANMSGEPLQRWRRGMVACAGGRLDDDEPDVQTPG